MADRTQTPSSGPQEQLLPALSGRDIERRAEIRLVSGQLDELKINTAMHAFDGKIGHIKNILQSPGSPGALDIFVTNDVLIALDEDIAALKNAPRTKQTADAAALVLMRLKMKEQEIFGPSKDPAKNIDHALDWACNRFAKAVIHAQKPSKKAIEGTRNAPEKMKLTEIYLDSLSRFGPNEKGRAVKAFSDRGWPAKTVNQFRATLDSTLAFEIKAQTSQYQTLAESNAIIPH